MQEKKRCILAIDTSNYTTSVAVTDQRQEILADNRILLKVKQGERGLRQSDALFQHGENLPLLMEKAFQQVDPSEIAGICVSDRPRPVEGSYMPVFLAGVNCGKILATALQVPFYTFSHQEGHLAAAAYQTSLCLEQPFLAFHLSGGTCELLEVSFLERDIEKIGGSKDISFGQLLDRVGVAAGLSFPAGREMDEMVLALEKTEALFKPIPFDGLCFNLSGIETQALRTMQEGKRTKEEIIGAIFIEISRCLLRITKEAHKNTGVDKFLFSGGVCASKCIRITLERELQDPPFEIIFGEAALSSDNAVGLALMGGKILWP